MKTVQMVKLSKGYYVITRNGCNGNRAFYKTKGNAETAVKVLKKQGYEEN